MVAPRKASQGRCAVGVGALQHHRTVELWRLLRGAHEQSLRHPLLGERTGDMSADGSRRAGDGECGQGGHDRPPVGAVTVSLSSSARVAASNGPTWRRPLTKKVGCPARAARLRARDVGAHPGVHLVPVEVADELLDVEPQVAGVADQVLELQLVLVLEEQVVQVPEPPLPVGGDRRPGSELGVLVDVVQRQVTEHVAQVVAELLAELAGHAGGAGAEGALEVAVLDEGQRRVGPTAEMVPPGVDRLGEAARQVCVALAAEHPPGLEEQPAQQGGEHSREQDADGRLVLQLGVVEGEAGDEEGDGEADPRQRAAAGDVAGTHALREPAEPEPGTQQRRAGRPPGACRAPARGRRPR